MIIIIFWYGVVYVTMHAMHCGVATSAKAIIRSLLALTLSCYLDLLHALIHVAFCLSLAPSSIHPCHHACMSTTARNNRSIHVLDYINVYVM